MFSGRTAGKAVRRRSRQSNPSSEGLKRNGYPPKGKLAAARMNSKQNGAHYYTLHRAKERYGGHNPYMLAERAWDDYQYRLMEQAEKDAA